MPVLSEREHCQIGKEVVAKAKNAETNVGIKRDRQGRGEFPDIQCAKPRPIWRQVLELCRLA